MIIHPKKVIIKGIGFEVEARASLTDAQAKKIAIHFYATHKFTAKDRGKLFRVVTQFDEDSVGLL